MVTSGGLGEEMERREVQREEGLGKRGEKEVSSNDQRQQ